ncbi:MAG: cupin domain-containing protein [Burkholderiales bacterium]|nr:cupin domain-containing protein [Burkholderiales bacterium]
MRRHWQKKPLLARGALPGVENLLRRETLFALAAREDLESRLVLRRGGRWRVEHGPFSPRRLAPLRGGGWSLLVQGVDHVLPAAGRLLREFAFLPHARLDDVMVSFAPPGAGVGPHFDSYDVFLVQGAGRRRWRIGPCRPEDLLPGAPLRILRDFRATAEWVLDPGDVLYLPPGCGHDGVALTDCITISIGFRAPTARELGARFLEYLEERLALDGMYRDPDLAPRRRPGLIDARMLRRMGRMLDGIRWRHAEVADFLGRYLTEPKPGVVYARPPRPLPPRRFAAAARRRGLRLAGATRMLYRGRKVFMNGDACAGAGGSSALLQRLADHRELPPRERPDPEALARLYEWYRAGYIHLGNA